MAKRLLKKGFLWICILSISFLSVSLNVYADKQTGYSKGKICLIGMLSDVKFCMHNVNVEMNGLTAQELRNLANVLETKVMLKGQKPLSTAISNKKGMVKWENVENGTYLITGEEVIRNEKLYKPAPILVEIEDNEVTIGVKYFERLIKKEIDINVVKVWDDEGYQEKRPEEVEVWLLRNYKVYKKIELNRDNNWVYTWKGLDARSVWKVIEGDVPEGYTMSVEEDDYEFVITNTYKEESTPEDKPVIPDDEPTTPDDEPTTPDDEPTTPDDEPTTPDDEPTTPDDEPTTPDDEPTTPDEGTDGSGVNGETDKNTGKTEGQKLPQSGQIWWPVPVFMAAGVLCFLIGWRKRDVN